MIVDMTLTFEKVQIDQVRDYWDRRPCNVRHSQLPIGTKEYFDEVEARKYLVEPHIPGFAQFERWRNKKVLEIGCGIGTDTINFARHGAKVIAVDLSEKSLEIARRRSFVFGVQDQVEFLSGNAEELSRFVPVGPYDLIYSFGVIHHTPCPERVLEQMRQCAKPGTVVKIMVYHRRAWKVLWILLSEGMGRFWKLSDLVARNSEAQTRMPHYLYVHEARSPRAARAPWLSSDGHLCGSYFPYRIPDYVQYRYRKVSYFRWMPPATYWWLERHSAGTSVLRQR